MRKLLISPLFVVLLASFAGSTEAGWEEGVAAYKSGNLAEAARQFQTVTEEHPDWPDGYYMLGQVLSKLKKNQEALNASRKAYDLNPGDVRFQLALGTTYLQSNRYRDAAELLSKINEGALSAQQKKIYHQALAVAMDKTGQTGAAMSALQKATQSNPNDAAAQFNFGAAAFNAGQTSVAVTALEKAVRLDSKDPAMRKAYTDALLKSGRETRGSGKSGIYTKAAESAKALVALKPTYDNFLLLGEAQLGAKQYGEAVQTFNQAAAKNSSAWIPHFYIGQASTAKADYPRAETALKKALDMGAPSADKNRIWRQLGFVYEKQRRFDEAISAYTTAGDSGGVERVQGNSEIAKHNQQADREQQEYEELKRKERELQEELKKLGTGAPPPV